MKQVLRSAPFRCCMLFCSAMSFLLLAGCHSRFVEVTIENHEKSPLRLLEVDYPSASFGVGTLAAGSQFHYRFKIQGSGPVKLAFTDAQNQLHNEEGPEVKQDQEGRMLIIVGPNGNVAWNPTLATP